MPDFVALRVPMCLLHQMVHSTARRLEPMVELKKPEPPPKELEEEHYEFGECPDWLRRFIFKKDVGAKGQCRWCEKELTGSLWHSNPLSNHGNCTPFINKVIKEYFTEELQCVVCDNTTTSIVFNVPLCREVCPGIWKSCNPLPFRRARANVIYSLKHPSPDLLDKRED